MRIKNVARGQCSIRTFRTYIVKDTRSFLLLIKNGALGVLVECWFNPRSDCHLIVVKSEIVYNLAIRTVVRIFFLTMSSVVLRDVGGLAPFDCSDTAGISARWERWLRAFELFADGKGVKNADQKKALMLHTTRV